MYLLIVYAGISPTHADDVIEDKQDSVLQVIWVREEGHVNNSYVGQLLAIAFDRCGCDYSISIIDTISGQGREINKVKSLPWSLMSAGTSIELENELIPIRIPLYRGLAGYRIGIINREKQPIFSAVTTIDDFRTLSVGQGIGWSDVEILENAGFTTVTADHDKLYRMVARGRFDIFLRGVNEIYSEVAQHSTELPELVAESDLALHYPFAMFFFVNRSQPELATAIESGLLAAYADGSFHELFNTHPQTRSVLDQARLAERRVFRIENPSLSNQTKAIPDKFWLEVE